MERLSNQGRPCVTRVGCHSATTWVAGRAGETPARVTEEGVATPGRASPNRGGARPDSPGKASHRAGNPGRASPNRGGARHHNNRASPGRGSTDSRGTTR